MLHPKSEMRVDCGEYHSSNVIHLCKILGHTKYPQSRNFVAAVGQCLLL